MFGFCLSYRKLCQRPIHQHGHRLAQLQAEAMQTANVAAVDAWLVEALVVVA